ncbi:MAG: hypothetical protein H6625_05845 [Bdellovibrionaceae bacterium]|nr:hypothetical protein [Pseudobdellovibrionaceae bacterium]
MRHFYNFRQSSEIYLSGIKHLLAHPYKLNHVVSSDRQLVKKILNNVISRVKNPLAWIYQLQLVKLSAEECQVKIQAPPVWTQSAGLFHSQCPLLYSAEQCLQLFWENAFAFEFSMKVNKLELHLLHSNVYPVQCEFSMDISDRNQMEWDLKTKGFLVGGFSFNFFSQNNDLGYIYMEIEMTLPKSLPASE